VQITPLADEDAFEVWVYLHAPSSGWEVEVVALERVPQGGPAAGDAGWNKRDGALASEGVVSRVAGQTSGATARLRLHLPHARRWTPESPHLYELRVRLRKHGSLLDEVVTYGGLRSVRLHDGRVLLNGQPVYLAMVLDQGYWPEGLLAAPSDAAMRADVEWAKRLGFNGVRKHQKIEDPRWLYWCDRLGLLVWEEMPNARAWSAEAEELMIAEWERAVRRDYNHPCIVTWVPVNESMGLRERNHPGRFAFLERAVRVTRRLDPHRPIVDNDGWEHTDVTDVCAIHDYTPDARHLRERYRQALSGGALPAVAWDGVHPVFARGSRSHGQPVVLSEVGGFLELPPDTPEAQRDFLYSLYAAYRTSDELLARYHQLVEGLSDLRFLAGFCYTQLTDIEQEKNGLLTYDRRPKVDPPCIAMLHQGLGERLPPGEQP
jgi:hypothetical protein